MKRAGALALLVAVGVSAGRALADPVPIPTLPTVTVAVPPAPVPLPATPELPAPTPTPAPALSLPLDVGSAPAAATGVQAPSLGGVVPAGSSAGSSSSGATTSDASGSSAAASRSRVTHFHSSRTWIGTSGPAKRRTTTLTFVLPRAARVVFTVKQVSPVCRTAGRFTIAGHAGLNRVRFAGRIGRKRLEAGTYRITARTRSGRLVQRVTLVVVDGGAPSRAELAAARRADVCAAMRGAALAARGSTEASDTLGVATRKNVQRSLEPETGAAGPAQGLNSHSGAVLASTAERAARAIRPALVVLLALSILLLGIASLPRTAFPDPRLNDLLVRHRLEIAGIGAAALVAVAVAFLLG